MRFKKRELQEMVEELVSKSTYKEWIELGHPTNFEAGKVNLTKLNKDLTNFMWNNFKDKGILK